jgi:hypothetical protein
VTLLRQAHELLWARLFVRPLRCFATTADKFIIPMTRSWNATLSAESSPGHSCLQPTISVDVESKLSNNISDYLAKSQPFGFGIRVFVFVVVFSFVSPSPCFDNISSQRGEPTAHSRNDTPSNITRELLVRFGGISFLLTHLQCPESGNTPHHKRRKLR